MDSDQTPTHKAFFVQTFTSRQVFQITHHLNCQNLQTVAECSDVQKRKTGKTLNWCQIFVFKKNDFFHRIWSGNKISNILAGSNTEHERARFVPPVRWRANLPSVETTDKTFSEQSLRSAWQIPKPSDMLLTISLKLLGKYITTWGCQATKKRMKDARRRVCFCFIHSSSLSPKIITRVRGRFYTLWLENKKGCVFPAGKAMIYSHEW